MIPREDWLAARRQGIGGSDIAAAAGLSPYKTPYQLYLEKRGEADPDDLSDNEAVHFGNVLEDVVAEEYCRRTGRRVRRVNRILRHPEHAFMLANLDRDVVGEPRILECKTAGRWIRPEDWGPSGTDQVPESYLLQTQWYLAVTGKQVADLAVLIAGQDFRIYEIPREDALIDDLIAIGAEFWGRVESGTPPDPSTIEDARLRWPRDSGDARECNLDTEIQVQRLKDLKRQIKTLEADAETLQTEIIAQIADAAALTFEGRTLCTYKAQSNRRLDTKAAQAALGELLDPYYTTTESRVFRLK